MLGRGGPSWWSSFPPTPRGPCTWGMDARRRWGTPFRSSGMDGVVRPQGVLLQRRRQVRSSFWPRVYGPATRSCWGRTAEIPEGGYQGEYVRDIARRLLVAGGAALQGMTMTPETLDFMRRFAVRGPAGGTGPGPLGCSGSPSTNTTWNPPSTPKGWWRPPSRPSEKTGLVYRQGRGGLAPDHRVRGPERPGDGQGRRDPHVFPP